jgi:hypothetical protein
MMYYLEDDEEISQFFAQSRSNYTVSPNGSILNTQGGGGEKIDSRTGPVRLKQENVTEIVLKSIDFDEGTRAL